MAGKNKDIRLMIAENNILMCDVAKEIGYSESSLYRFMRSDLDPAMRKSILKAIDRLKDNDTNERD